MDNKIDLSSDDALDIIEKLCSKYYLLLDEKNDDAAKYLGVIHKITEHNIDDLKNMEKNTTIIDKCSTNIKNLPIDSLNVISSLYKDLSEKISGEEYKKIYNKINDIIITNVISTSKISTSKDLQKQSIRKQLVQNISTDKKNTPVAVKQTLVKKQNRSLNNLSDQDIAIDENVIAFFNFIDKNEKKSNIYQLILNFLQYIGVYKYSLEQKVIKGVTTLLSHVCNKVNIDPNNKNMQIVDMLDAINKSINDFEEAIKPQKNITNNEYKDMQQAIDWFNKLNEISNFNSIIFTNIKHIYNLSLNKTQESLNKTQDDKQNNTNNLCLTSQCKTENSFNAENDVCEKFFSPIQKLIKNRCGNVKIKRER